MQQHNETLAFVRHPFTIYIHYKYYEALFRWQYHHRPKSEYSRDKLYWQYAITQTNDT
jgi:hypothetical protein